MALRIEDYAIIGDCHTAALSGKDGSIDWCCLPRFDSAACFAALLGSEENGFWRIAPAGPSRVRRRYREDTLVLETEHQSPDGVVTVVDFMPPRAADPVLARVVRCERGRVPMKMCLALRFDYGAAVPWVRRCEGGIHAVAGPDAVVLRAGVALRGEGLRTLADFVVEERDQVAFALAWHPSHRPIPGPVDVVAARRP